MIQNRVGTGISMTPEFNTLTVATVRSLAIYIDFTMYLDITYITRCIAKVIHLEKAGTSYNLEQRKYYLYMLPFGSGRIWHGLFVTLVSPVPRIVAA